MEYTTTALFEDLKGLLGLDNLLEDGDDGGTLFDDTKKSGQPYNGISIGINEAANPDLLLQESNLLLAQLMGLTDLDSLSTFDHVELTELAQFDILSTACPITDNEIPQPVCQLSYVESSSQVESPCPTLPSEPTSPQPLEDFMPKYGATTDGDFFESLFPLHSGFCDETYGSDHSTDALSDTFDSGSNFDSDSTESPFLQESSCSESGDCIDDDLLKSAKKKSSKRKIPYSKLPVPKKERKKLQNKNAANRYRQKKKEAMNSLSVQEQDLQKRNSELKSEVLNLEREILCIKELLSEVFDCNSY